MQTAHDRAAATVHTGVTSAINPAIGHSSVAQTIEQAIHDTTSSAPAQSPVGSMLPGSIADTIAAASQALEQAGATGNPGAGQAPGFGFDLHAPSAGDFLSQVLGSLGVSASQPASGSDTQGPPGSSIPGYDNAAFWIGDQVQSAGTAPVPVRTNSDGEVVNTGNGNASSDFPTFAGLGGALSSGLKGPTADAMQQALHEDDVNSGRTDNGSNGAGGTNNAGQNSAGGSGSGTGSTGTGSGGAGGNSNAGSGSGTGSHPGDNTAGGNSTAGGGSGNPSNGTPDNTNGSGSGPSNGSPDNTNGSTGNTSGSGSDGNSADGPNFSSWNDVFGAAKGYQDSNGDQHFATDTGFTYDPGHGWGRVITDTDVTTGTTTVTHADNSVTKTDKDGNPIPTEGSSIPVDPSLQDGGGKDPAKLAAVAQMHQFLHGNDNTNVAGSDIPGTVSRDEVTGGNPTGAHPGFGGDPGNVEGGQDGGQVKGAVTPTTNFNGSAGAIDYGPDHDGTPQTDGPSPRSTPGMAPIGHQTGGQSTGGHQGSGEQSVPVTPPNHLAESNVQRAAHELQSAVDSSPSEGHKTAQEVQGAHTGTDIASVLGGASGSPDHGGFADLIRAAQNPVQAGLVTAAQPVVHPDLHLAFNGDLAGHDFSIPDLHAATATVAVHDLHDAHAIAAPALDHHVEVTHH